MKTHMLYALAALALLASCGDKKPEQQQTAAPVYTFSQPQSRPAFSGERALELAARQVDFGPRVPNTAAHDSARAFFIRHLEATGARVKVQEFSINGYEGERLKLANIMAQFNPDAKVRVLLVAHWDSRPRADMETDEAKMDVPIPGANDGASGVAVLLHLAEVFAENPPPIGVDLLLLDAEDYGKEGDQGNYCLGAQYFASTIAPEYDPQFGILLDLVGDADAQFYKEGYSMQFAPDIVKLVWENAAALGLPEFVDRRTDGVLDDHYWLSTTAGIKTINIIDSDLIGHQSPNPRRRYWHTLNDTMDNLSATTLGHVGELLVYTVFGLMAA